MNLSRFIFVTVVSQLVLIHAIEFDAAQVSECALSCMLETFPAANCSLTDTACQCQNQPLLVSTSECMVANCTLEDTLNLGKLRETTCHISPQSRQRTLFITNVSLGVSSLMMVSLRLLSRMLVCKRIWYDDGVILSAMLINIPFGILGGWMQVNGLGKHVWDVSITKIPEMFKLYYIDESLYLTIVLLTKVSILLFYLRIFPAHKFRCATKAMLVFVLCSGIVILLLQMFQCLPVAYNWDKSIRGAQCLNINVLTYTHAGMSIIQDLMILVLPISELATLKLERKQKIGVFLVFQVGAFACVTAMIRLRFLTKFGGTSSTDPTWDNVDATIWTAIEVNSGIICSCIPAVRALLKHKTAALLKSTSSSMWSILKSGHSRPSTGASSSSIHITVVDNAYSKAVKIEQPAMREVNLNKLLPLTPSSKDSGSPTNLV